MTTQIEQDTAVKSIIDTLASKYGYPEGKMDSDKGILSYDLTTPVLGYQEALNRVLFRNEIYQVLVAQPNMTITANFQQVVITLPDWEINAIWNTKSVKL